MDYSVFIQTNDKQILGAKLAEHAIRIHSRHNDKFDIRIMEYDTFDVIRAREGQTFLRDGGKREWVRDDLQSFTPTRFLPPQLMNYQGRAVVIDPDVFALADIWELLSRDMQGKAIMCRPKSMRKGIHGCMATSVMLLDCEKLTHWKFDQQFNDLFEFKRDYMKWICLSYEDRETIGLLEKHWNDLDYLDSETRMLHTTKRKTQPWKTGLPIDFRPADSFKLFPPRHWFRRARRALFGDYNMVGLYKKNPDPNQEVFIFSLMRDALDKGAISEEMLRDEMAKDHLRHDALELLDKSKPLKVA